MREFGLAREGRRGGELLRRRVDVRVERRRERARHVRREHDRRARVHLVRQLVERACLAAYTSICLLLLSVDARA